MGKIPIKVYEELKFGNIGSTVRSIGCIEWIDNNGINTPYIVMVVNNV